MVMIVWIAVKGSSDPKDFTELRTNNPGNRTFFLNDPDFMITRKLFRKVVQIVAVLHSDPNDCISYMATGLDITVTSIKPLQLSDSQTNLASPFRTLAIMLILSRYIKRINT